MNTAWKVLAVLICVAGCMQFNYWLSAMMPPELFGLLSGIAWMGVGGAVLFWRLDMDKEKP